MTRSIQTAIAAAALILTAVSAHAMPVQHINVQRNGLNLSQPADAQKMLLRLERAAIEACGSGHGAVQDVQDGIKRSDCFRQALTSGVASFKAPALNLAYAVAYPVQSTSQLASAGR